MMLLQELIAAQTITGITGSADIPVTGLQFDSRMVTTGNLFFAVRGTTSDGHDFIAKAIELGASAVVCEHLPASPGAGTCFIMVPDSSIALGSIASAWYGHPSRKLKLVGVTGTNGKTTIVTLLHRLFFELGYGTGLISTIVNKVNTAEVPASHTTPDPLQINALLAPAPRSRTLPRTCFMASFSRAGHLLYPAKYVFRPPPS